MSSISGYGRENAIDQHHQDDEECEEIVEGFLCPICHRDLKSFEFLTQHFEKYHSEDQDALKTIFKDIFQKAKDKIKQNFDDSFSSGNRINGTVATNAANTGTVGESFANNAQNPSKDRKPSASYKASIIFDERQEIGAHRSHFEYFNGVRRPWLERHASETNKLTFRLQRLLKNMPKDSVLRKQHEQNIVTWLDGSAVKLCPNCAKSFHIARRQHHCRLCGSIICQQCSHFLSLLDAIQLTTLLGGSSNMEDVRKTMETFHLKSDPTSSSSITEVSHDDDIRCCVHCLVLLEAQKDLLAGRYEQPPITKLYEEIQQIRDMINPDIKAYLKVVQSLYNGDTTYTLNDANVLRSKIGRMAELINLKCRNICSIPCEASSRSEILQRAIRLSCCQFIQDKVMSQPQPPKEEEITEIQRTKRIEAEQRIAMEQRLAMEVYEKKEYVARNMISLPETGNYARGSDLQSLDNWICNKVNSVATVEDSDPLIEQINIIKGYIKQAKEDGHLEVLQTLEKNLGELQAEFYNQQRSETQSVNTN